MKRLNRLLMALGLLTVFTGVSYAVAPVEINEKNGAYYDTQFFGSTGTLTTVTGAAINLTLAAPAARNSQGASATITQGRYCFTDFSVQLTTGIAYIVDNSTNPTASNNIQYYGAGVTIPTGFASDAKSPFCLPFGDSASIVIIPNTGGSNPAGDVTWQGYISYGKAGGSTSNHGQ